MHKIHTKQAPSYLTDEVTATADLHGQYQQISDSKDTYQIRRQKLSYAGPSAWNSLPHHVREITDTYAIQKTTQKCFVSKGVPRFLDFLDLDLHPFLFFHSFVSAGHIIFMQVFHYND